MTRPQPRPRGPRPAPDENIDPVDTAARRVLAEPPVQRAAWESQVEPASRASSTRARAPEGQIALNVSIPASVFAQLDEVVKRTGKTKKALVAEWITAAYLGS